jgi:hypothetical protein
MAWHSASAFQSYRLLFKRCDLRAWRCWLNLWAIGITILLDALHFRIRARAAQHGRQAAALRFVLRAADFNRCP